MMSMSVYSGLDASKPVVRKRFFREATPLVFRDVSRTQQQFVAACDINNIIKRYRVTGLMPQNQAQPLYGDFSDLPDYQASLNQVLRAEATFAALSSDLRERFGNDVAAFLRFAADPENKDQLVKWGFTFRDPPAPVLDPEPPAPPKQPAKQAAEPPKEA